MNAATPTVLQITWKVVDDVLMVLITRPALPSRPDCCSR